MKTRIRLNLLSGLFLLGALAALPLAAQFTGGIMGVVTGPDGKPMPKAQITFTRTDGKGSYKMKTDGSGHYGYYTLPTGMYNMTVTTPDGKTTVTAAKGVPNRAGHPVTVNVDMKALEAGEAPPPPGMTKAQAAAYEQKLKKQEEANKKLGTLNQLLQQNKQFVDAKQYPQAIAVMEKAVAIDQKHDILFANLAEDYNDAKQYSKAADAYRKAIALKPNDSGYVINLGTALSKAGKVDEANAEFAKAASMDPKAAKMAMYNSAVVLMNQGNLQGAAAAFTKYLALDPTNGDAWYYKGVSLMGTAQTDAKGNVVATPDMLQAFQNSIKYAPSGPNAANAKAALATLKSQGGSL